jgi:hypothetical protein
VDVKKLGRIPDGGGWRAHGRSEKVRGRGIGYDFIHVAVDDHTRIAYAEIHPDEKGTTCARFLSRAGAFFHAAGIERIERILTDNAFAYRNSQPSRLQPPTWARCSGSSNPAAPGPTARPSASTAPWPPNGPTPALHQQHRTDAALDPWLRHYNTERIHTGIGGTPINR